MKLECSKERLLRAVSKAEKITGKNLTLPVLSCLLMKAEKGHLKIVATNLDLGIEISIPVNSVEDGSVAIPGNIISGLLAGDFRSEKVNLETKENNLGVLTDSSSTIIKSQSSDDFPTIPRLDNETFFVIDAKKFLKGLKSVWYSSSTSNIKPELSSVLVYAESDNIVFAATDSFRLAEMRVAIDEPVEFEQVLIPFKNIPEIIRIFDDIEGDLKIYYTKNQIAFEYENIYLTSRVIDGNFPDYKQLIPKEFKTDIILLKEDLMTSLKLSNIFSDKFNKISLKISPKEKVFELTTKNNDVGESVVKIEGAMSGDDVEISFNQKYIMDCFQSITTDSLVLQFNGLNKPMVIRSVPNTGFTYLVMPMNK